VGFTVPAASSGGGGGGGSTGGGSAGPGTGGAASTPELLPTPVVQSGFTAVRGEVTVNGQPLQNGVAGPLFAGSEIRTGPHGLAVIEFPDGSKIAIGPNSSFTLEGDNTAQTLFGRIQLLLHRRFRVITPTAICGVRGTLLTVEVTDNSTRERTYKGAVDLQNADGRGKPVTVKRGLESTVRSSKPPSKPRKFKPPKHPFWQ
jgi:hypothetical protein